MTTQDPEEDVELAARPRPLVPMWVAAVAALGLLLAIRRRRRRRARARETSLIVVPQPIDTGIARLDVWERAVNAVEDAALLDIALGAVDTADRQSAAG
jgi:hypothetical protein